MSQQFEFETRELCPYREDWNRGGKYVKIHGALWYIKEEDSIFLLDTEKTRTHPNNRPYNRYRIAKGLPAALLAQGNELVQSDFDIRACYQAYYKEIEKIFPAKPTYHVPTILDDWKYTLEHSLIIERNISGFVDNYALMRVAMFIRAISNPYRIDSLEEKMNHNYYFTTSFDGKEGPQFVFSQMPAIIDRTEAPLIYAKGVDKSINEVVLQVDGFMAAVFNLSLFYYWQRRWSEYNFANAEIVDKVLKAFDTQSPIIEPTNLKNLSFDLPDEVEDICKAYMKAFMPIMQKVWKLKPTVQLACIEGENIYTYIYAHEVSSPEKLLNSELYANLTNDQKRTLYHYGRRFLEWLPKNYPITLSSQHHVMEAMAMDMPPIQFSVQNNVKIIRAADNGRQTARKGSAFAELIIDKNKEDEILEILHKRIDGRKGKDIGVVLAAAVYTYHLLTRTPTETEFREEFENIQKCSWRSISEWLKKPTKAGELRPDICEVVLEI